MTIWNQKTKLYYKHRDDEAVCATDMDLRVRWIGALITEDRMIADTKTTITVIIGSNIIVAVRPDLEQQCSEISKTAIINSKISVLACSVLLVCRIGTRTIAKVKLMKKLRPHVASWPKSIWASVHAKICWPKRFEWQNWGGKHKNQILKSMLLII